MSDDATLRALNARYIESFLTADVAWYERHLSPDFICIQSDASVLSRAQFLEHTAKGPNLASYSLEDVVVRQFGDAALIHGTGIFTRADGTKGISRYTDIYCRTAQGWQAVAAQITRAALPVSERVA